MEYSAVRGGKLTLKGAAKLDRQPKKKRGRGKRKRLAEDPGEPGMVRHGEAHKSDNLFRQELHTACTHIQNWP